MTRSLGNLSDMCNLCNDIPCFKLESGDLKLFLNLKLFQYKEYFFDEARVL